MTLSETLLSISPTIHDILMLYEDKRAKLLGQLPDQEGIPMHRPSKGSSWTILSNAFPWHFFFFFFAIPASLLFSHLEDHLHCITIGHYSYLPPTDTFCYGREAGHYMHPGSTSCFVQCDLNGLAYSKACAPGTQWHGGDDINPSDFNLCAWLPEALQMMSFLYSWVKHCIGYF